MRLHCSLAAILIGTGAFSADAMGGGPVVPVKPQAPVSGWLFDDGSGTTAVDTFGAYDGVLEGGMGDSNWTIDVPLAYAGNTALAFDGANDRVLLNEAGIVSHADSSTVAAWFWWDDPGSTRAYAIYNERDECGFAIYSLSIDRRTDVDNGLVFAIFDRPAPFPCGTGAWQVVTAPIEGIATETWHHAVGVLDEIDGLKLYLDGELVVTDRASTASYTGPTGPTTIGHLHTVAYNSWWSGQLDEIAVFSHALSDEEVLWLYENSVANLVCPTDIDGDGAVGIADLLALLAAWGPNPGHPADFDDDGTVGIADLLALLAGWGTC